MYHVAEVLQQAHPQGYMPVHAAAQAGPLHPLTWSRTQSIDTRLGLAPNLLQVQFVWKSGETPD